MWILEILFEIMSNLKSNPTLIHVGSHPKLVMCPKCVTTGVFPPTMIVGRIIGRNQVKDLGLETFSNRYACTEEWKINNLTKWKVNTLSKDWYLHRRKKNIINPQSKSLKGEHVREEHAWCWVERSLGGERPNVNGKPWENRTLLVTRKDVLLCSSKRCSSQLLVGL